MFAEAKYCLYSKTQLPPGLRSQMTHADGTLSRFWTMALPRLLYRAATFKQCTDPRDKIYGLLGLAPNKFAHSIKVDYRENNTAADVFTMAVLNHASITLRFVRVEDPRLSPLAGWERVERELDRDDPTIYDFFWNKDAGKVVNYDPRLEPGALEARGVKLEWVDLV